MASGTTTAAAAFRPKINGRLNITIATIVPKEARIPLTTAGRIRKATVLRGRGIQIRGIIAVTTITGLAAVPLLHTLHREVAAREQVREQTLAQAAVAEEAEIKP